MNILAAAIVAIKLNDVWFVWRCIRALMLAQLSWMVPFFTGNVDVG